jgi:hypothetical protein
MDAAMPTPELIPADGDPPENPAAAELAPVQRDRLDAAATPRTEHPVPESFPSVGAAGSSA